MLVNLNLDVKSTACENVYAIIDIYLNNVLLTSHLQLSEEVLHLTFSDVDIFEKDVNFLRVDVLNDMANFDPVTNEVSEIVSAVFTKIEYIMQDGKKLLIVPRKNENMPKLMKFLDSSTLDYISIRYLDYASYDIIFNDINKWVAFGVYEELKFDNLGLIVPNELNYR